MPVQFVVFLVEPCEVFGALEIMFDGLPAIIQNRLSVLMQKLWEQNVAPKEMIDDKVL